MLVVFLGLLLSLLALTLQFGHTAKILKKLLVLAIAFSVLLFPSLAPAQTTAPDQNVSADASPAPTAETAYERPISWKLMSHNVIADQKRIWSFPARLTHGHNWIATAAVLGATVALMRVDSSEAGYFRQTTTFNGFRNIFTGNAMAGGIGAAPASLYAIGLLRKDSKMQRTALLAGEAMADGAIVQTLLKDVTRRVRPTLYPDSGWLASPGAPSSYIRGNGSFPSGHAIEAFGVATIIARRYGNHRWVPYAAYGLAALVGFERLTLNVHFLSDVFMGSALGYSIGRFTVLRQ